MIERDRPGALAHFLNTHEGVSIREVQSLILPLRNLQVVTNAGGESAAATACKYHHLIIAHVLFPLLFLKAATQVPGAPVLEDFAT